jgi:putative hemolysin
MLSVESLISSNFPGFENQSRLFRQPIVKSFRYLFHETEVQRLEALNPYLVGISFVEQVLDYFDFKYRVSDKEKEQIPASGKVVIVANHPIGSLDGLALIKLISGIRGDVKIVANRLLGNIDQLKEFIIPIDNRSGSRLRVNLRNIDQHLKQEGVVILFPAGEVSGLSLSGVRDGVWNSGFLKLALKHQAPILPIHIKARNSWVFYSLSIIYKPLASLWLIREMFKQSHNSIRLSIGALISHDSYSKIPLNLKSKSNLFKHYVYQLAKTNSVKGIAHPECRQRLTAETGKSTMIIEILLTKRAVVSSHLASVPQASRNHPGWNKATALKTGR